MENTIESPVISEIPKAFQNGFLINLRARKWGATSKAENEEKFGEEFQAEIYKAVQDLLDEEGRELLKSLDSVKNSCNSVINSQSIQFAIPGFRFAKENADNSRLGRIYNVFLNFKDQYFEIANNFCERYDSLKQNYQEKFPNDYRPEKYPTIEKLKKSFDFTLQIFEFKGPGEALKAVNPELYKQQMNEIKRNCAEMSQMVLQVFSTALIDRLEVLVGQCNGKGNINNRTIDSINNLVFRFEDLYKDFVDEKQLEDFTKDIKEYLNGVDSDLLRADDDFRNLVAKKASEIAETVKCMPAIGEKLLRKIEL